MTSTDRPGRDLAPARLARKDVATLRRVYRATRVAPPPNTIFTTEVALHPDDPHTEALARLGGLTDRVWIRVEAGETRIAVTVGTQVGATFSMVAVHRFRRSTTVKEWTRILGRHCRHAFGLLAYKRTPVYQSLFGASKEP